MAAYSYKYEWKVNGLYKVDAETANDEFNRVVKEKGELTPENLVNASRDPAAPLHGEFEWNDGIAAEKYRNSQGADMIRNLIEVRITEEEAEPMKIRKWVTTPGGTHLYEVIEKVMNNDLYREHLLQCAKNDMRAFIAKYRTLKELAGVVTDMKRFLNQ